MKHQLFPQIQSYCEERITEFHLIPQERKENLQSIAEYIRYKHQENKVIQLVYVCTNNSRRSHFGQIWGAVAASYFNRSRVFTYSGGTEPTAFHPNALEAIQRIGFVVAVLVKSSNPHYDVQYGEGLTTSCFSKTYNDNSNPKENFAVIMTCSDADENCPFIQNVELRISTTYKDPKVFDGTLQQDEQYDERCGQIARENLYMFSVIDKSL